MFKIFLLSASLLFSSIIYSKTLLEDALIFKIVDQIYSVEDVKKTYHDYLQLKCFFPEEKIGSLIKMPERKFDEEFFKIGKTFTSEQKKVYLQFKTLLKLITYVSAQNVAVNSNLKQVISESYEKLKCSKKIFKKFTKKEFQIFVYRLNQQKDSNPKFPFPEPILH